LAQFTLAKPDFPNVPLASDLPKTQAGRQAIEFLTSDFRARLAASRARPNLPTETR